MNSIITIEDPKELFRVIYACKKDLQSTSISIFRVGEHSYAYVNSIVKIILTLNCDIAEGEVITFSGVKELSLIEDSLPIKIEPFGSSYRVYQDGINIIVPRYEGQLINIPEVVPDTKLSCDLIHRANHHSKLMIGFAKMMNSPEASIIFTENNYLIQYTSGILIGNGGFKNLRFTSATLNALSELLNRDSMCVYDAKTSTLQIVVGNTIILAACIYTPPESLKTLDGYLSMMDKATELHKFKFTKASDKYKALIAYIKKRCYLFISDTGTALTVQNGGLSSTITDGSLGSSTECITVNAAVISVLLGIGAGSIDIRLKGGSVWIFQTPLANLILGKSA